MNYILAILVLILFIHDFLHYKSISIDDYPKVTKDQLN